MSRRDAERAIALGRVAINGGKIDSPVNFVGPGDTVALDGRVLNARRGRTLVMFHKPAGYMTTRSDPGGRPTIYDILPEKYKHLKYIGRLDFNTSGLLLLTDDGAFADELTHSGARRVYIAKLNPSLAEGSTRRYRASGEGRKCTCGNSIPSPASPAKQRGSATPPQGRGCHAAVRAFLSPTSTDDSIFDPLRRGATIGGIHYKPMEIEVLSRYPLRVRVAITEGKKNEIRRAFDYIGLPVAKLHRVSYGEYELGDLAAGGVKVKK
jgi:23S rRNA pseudouridine2605 synthase